MQPSVLSVHSHRSAVCAKGVFGAMSTIKHSFPERVSFLCSSKKIGTACWQAGHERTDMCRNSRFNSTRGLYFWQWVRAWPALSRHKFLCNWTRGEGYQGSGMSWWRAAFPDLLELMDRERLQLSSCGGWLNVGFYCSQPAEEEIQED